MYNGYYEVVLYITNNVRIHVLYTGHYKVVPSDGFGLSGVNASATARVIIIKALTGVAGQSQPSVGRGGGLCPLAG